MTNDACYHLKCRETTTFDDDDDDDDDVIYVKPER